MFSHGAGYRIKSEGKDFAPLFDGHLPPPRSPLTEEFEPDLGTWAREDPLTVEEIRLCR